MGAAARSLHSEATGSRCSFGLRCQPDPLHSCAVCSGLLCDSVRWERVPHLIRGEWGGLSADRVAEWFAQQPLACICLELRSSLEYVTKFLSLSHNWSLLPASLAMRPWIRASPPAHPTKSFMFPNRSLSKAPRFQQQQTSICLPNSWDMMTVVS